PFLRSLSFPPRRSSDRDEPGLPCRLGLAKFAPRRVAREITPATLSIAISVGISARLPCSWSDEDVCRYREAKSPMMRTPLALIRSEEHTSELQSRFDLV